MKKFTKIALLFSMVVIMVVAIAACNKDNPDNGKVDLSWNSQPRLTYVLGQDLDTSIGVLNVNKNGSSTKVNLNSEGVQITGYNKNQLGAQTLTVTYQGASTTYTVTVNKRISLENVELNYIDGEQFKRTGKVNVTTDGGEVKQCDFADPSKITLSQIDMATPGTKTVTLTYKEGIYNYSDTFEINVYAVAGEPVVQAPTDNKAWSHDTTLKLDGGRVTFKTTNSSFSRTVDMKDMTIDADVDIASLFSAATSENTEANPLQVAIKLKYCGHEATVTINVRYSPVSGFVEKFDKDLLDLSVIQNKDESGTAIPNDFIIQFTNDADNEKKVLEDLWTDYNNLSNEFKTALSKRMGTFSGNENSYLQRYIMLASLYFYQEYNNLLKEYINTDEKPAIFGVDPTTFGLGAEAPTYEVTKADYTKLMEQLDKVTDAGKDNDGVDKFKVKPKSGTNMEKLFKYSDILNTIKSDSVLGNLNFGTTEVPFKSFFGTDYGHYVESFSDFLNGFGAYDGHGTLEMIKNMLEIYEKMKDVNSSNASDKGTEIEATFAFITGSTNLYFTDLKRPQGNNYYSQYRQVYQLIDEWRELADTDGTFDAKDGLFSIIYKHYYDKDVKGKGDQAKWDNIDKLAHVCFPAEIEDYYNFLSGAAFDFYYTVYLQRFGMHHMGNAYYDYYSAIDLNKKFAAETDTDKKALIDHLLTTINLDFGYFGQIQGNSQYNTLDYIYDFLEPNVIAQFQLNVYQNKDYDAILDAYLKVLKDYENSTCFAKTATAGTTKFTAEYKKNFEDFLDKFTGASPELQLQFLQSFCGYDELLLDYDSASSLGQQFIETVTLVFTEYFAVELTFDPVGTTADAIAAADEKTNQASSIYSYYIKAYEMFLRRDASGVYDAEDAMYNYNAGLTAYSTADEDVQQRIMKVMDPIVTQLQIFSTYCDDNGKIDVPSETDQLFTNFKTALNDLDKLFGILNKQNKSRLVKLTVLSAYEYLEYLRDDIEEQILAELEEPIGDTVVDMYASELSYRYDRSITLPNLSLKNATPEAAFYGIRGLVVNMLLTVWPSFNGNDEVVGAVTYFDNAKVREFLLNAHDLLVNYGLNIENNGYDDFYTALDNMEKDTNGDSAKIVLKRVDKMLEAFQELTIDEKVYIYSLDAENDINSLVKALSVFYARTVHEKTYDELSSTVAKYLELEKAFFMYAYADHYKLANLDKAKEAFEDAYEIFTSDEGSETLLKSDLTRAKLIVKNYEHIKNTHENGKIDNAYEDASTAD